MKSRDNLDSFSGSSGLTLLLFLASQTCFVVTLPETAVSSRLLEDNRNLHPLRGCAALIFRSLHPLLGKFFSFLSSFLPLLLKLGIPSSMPSAKASVQKIIQFTRVCCSCALIGITATTTTAAVSTIAATTRAAATLRGEGRCS